MTAKSKGHDIREWSVGDRVNAACETCGIRLAASPMTPRNLAKRVAAHTRTVVAR